MNFACNGYFRLGPVMLALIVAGCSSNEPKWAATNKKVIEESKVTGRTRELPQVKVPSALVEGEAVEAGKLPSVTFAPGVTAKLWWGRGALVEKIEMQPDAQPGVRLGQLDRLLKPFTVRHEAGAGDNPVFMRLNNAAVDAFTLPEIVRIHNE